MSKTYLVTGAAGFIGSHTVDRLLARGESVLAVDNFNDYYDPVLKEKNVKEQLKNSNYRLFRADFENFDAMQIIFGQFPLDAIIHLGARAGVRASIDTPLLYQQANMQGTANLLELAHQHNIHDLVLASSSSVYGNRTDGPFKETDRVDNPISPYAATKKGTELLAHSYAHLYDMNIACLRFFTVYGPRGRPDMAPMKFTKLISNGISIQRYGDGSMQRSFTYVDDITDGVLASIDKNKGYEIYNLGNDRTVSLSDFISILENAIGKKAEIEVLPEQPGDVKLTHAEITKARSMLGFDPKTSIEEGLKKMVEWYNLQNL